VVVVEHPQINSLVGKTEISNFKSSNTLRNSVYAYPFPRDKRFRNPKPNYIDSFEADSLLTDKKVIGY